MLHKTIKIRHVCQGVNLNHFQFRMNGKFHRCVLSRPKMEHGLQKWLIFAYLQLLLRLMVIFLVAGVSFAMKEGLAGETVVGAVDSEFLSPSWLALVSKGEPDDDEDHCGDPADFPRTPNCLWWPVQLQRLNLNSDQFDLADLIVLVVGSAAAAVAGVLDQDLKTLDRKILLSILPGVKNKIKKVLAVLSFLRSLSCSTFYFFGLSYYW